ncbi:glycoside hydrolase family 65 protein [Enterococcus sp. AZ194]|uniref:glycoside hydrolase family 65 protein n=1 Tax=Enterococcus sp. AZ194 TaxID=2774629 RepID=UPI003F6839E9
MYKRLFDIDPWKIATHSLDRENKRLMESLTSIGNGYMGMRGMFEETYTGDTHQGTYLAGVWFPDKTRVGWWKNGYPDYFGKVINATNFIGVKIVVNNQELDLAKQEVNDFYVELDMKNGLLSRTFIYQTAETKIKFTFERFVSIVQRELAFIRLTMTVLEGTPKLSVSSLVDGQVKNEDSNYEEMFWLEKNRQLLGDVQALTVQTIENPFEVPQFSVTTAIKNLGDLPNGQEIQAPLLVGQTYEWQAEKRSYSLEKMVAVVTSRDVAEEKQVIKATELLEVAGNKNFDQHLQEQTAAWQKRWNRADVQIKGDAEAQQGIRFNLFQLFSTYYGEDERLNVGPKGFTGEKYGGATYWDTEAYIVPMYLSVADASVTKRLLEYRYDQLPGAFINAQRQGLKGALYPMVTFTGVECHNEWEITFEEIHRNGSIAYAIYNYTNYTGDRSYIDSDGIKVLVSIARFWADRVHYSKRHKAYMIHGVTGPNEYENNVNNNWYTNTIAAWVLRYTLENYELAQAESKAQLQVTEEEKAQWQEIAAHMYLPKDDDLGVFVQHDTFLDKELMSAADLPESARPLNQNWSWDHILRSCFIKQADVLQGIYYFGHEYTLEEKERNFDFYEPMTVHESSLSPCVHSILAAELGKEEKAVELYARTARLDLDNYNNDTEDGLHVTSMSGSWLAIVQGFAGMRTFGGQLRFAPFCPANWDGYSFPIGYQDRLIEVSVTKESLMLRLLEGEPLEVVLFEKTQMLKTVIEQTL